jgi:heme exporter protein C
MAGVVDSSSAVHSGTVRLLLLGLAGLLFMADLYLIFEWVNTGDRSLGLQAQRLFYFHVPTALVGFISMGVAAAASVAYLGSRTRNPRWDRVAFASVEVGTIFFTAAIVTGAIWAKSVWSTWWVWDANGTLTFSLWLIFISYLIVRAYSPDAARGGRWGAIVAIVGAVAVPFVYIAADRLEGLHPARVTGPSAPGSIDDSRILATLVFSLIAFTVLFATLTAERVAQRANEQRLEELRRMTA